MNIEDFKTINNVLKRGDLPKCPLILTQTDEGKRPSLPFIPGMTIMKKKMV